MGQKQHVAECVWIRPGADEKERVFDSVWWQQASLTGRGDD